MNAKKILIVEDEWLIAKKIKNTVEKNGYEVTDVVKYGTKAIASAEKQRPDLILMDIHLLGTLDGLETAKQIGIKNDYSIPIVYLSNPKSSLLVKYAGQDKNRITDFLTKPFTSEQLAITIFFNLTKAAKLPPLPISPPPSIPKLPLPQVRDFFFVKKGKDTQVPIQVKDVLFIETDGSGTGSFVVVATEALCLDKSLKQFLKDFPHPNFLQISQSFIVNIRNINVVKTRDNNIHFENVDTITRATHQKMRYFKRNSGSDDDVWNGIILIGRTYRKRVKEVLKLLK